MNGQMEFAHVTVKLVPSLVRADGCALVWPEEFTITIVCVDEPKLAIAPVIPFTVAEHVELIVV